MKLLCVALLVIMSHHRVALTIQENSTHSYNPGDYNVTATAEASPQIEFTVPHASPQSPLEPVLSDHEGCGTTMPNAHVRRGGGGPARGPVEEISGGSFVPYVEYDRQYPLMFNSIFHLSDACSIHFYCPGGSSKCCRRGCCSGNPSKCCNGNCLKCSESSVCCGEGCCPEKCCHGRCCPGSSVCCGRTGECCPLAFPVCCGEGKGCCPKGTRCCGSRCCRK